MNFLRRRLAQLKLAKLFRKKKKSKFQECVNKVIEARRSGCIDDQGNILYPLKKMLEQKQREQIQAEKLYSEITKLHKLQRKDSRPPSCMSRESYPLPQEDDGSEGYASASELENFEFNPTIYLERNRAAGLPNNCIPCRYDSKRSGGSERKVRFSDDVCRISNYSYESSCSYSSEGDGPEVDSTDTSCRHRNDYSDDQCDDRFSLTLEEKISFFNQAMRAESRGNAKKMSKSTSFIERGYQPGTGSLKSKVAMFENLSKGGSSSQRSSRTEEWIRSETRSKIRFFETLGKCNSMQI
ncbi:hypothetical protein HOLleu_28060 [Holothuria leucospilota]|uniref:Uncharacterized protein n=1 Tax=Holothuria leucospilota TaxID=206669 RepID=A0A9Q1BQS9_HOLLE|nr:hypothetical protein HOLleu_28060 [Holothuria leucospilota]